MARESAEDMVAHTGPAMPPVPRPEDIAAAAVPPAPVSEPAQTMIGYIDGLDAQWHVVGWVRSLVAVQERLRVELIENGRVVGSDTAQRFRGDLLEAGHGDGHHGFQLAILASLFDGLRHGLAVRVAQPGQAPAVLGQLDIILPSRLPKTAKREDAARPGSAARLVDRVLGGAVAQPAHQLEAYIQQLTELLGTVAYEYDHATALGLLYVHILRRHIDDNGLQTRLTWLSTKPEALGEVVREVVNSDEALGRLKTPSGYHLPELEAVRAWTRLRPVA